MLPIHPILIFNIQPVDFPAVAEICRKFGGPDELRNAVTQLQSLLYAA